MFDNVETDRKTGMDLKKPVRWVKVRSLRAGNIVTKGVAKGVEKAKVSCNTASSVSEPDAPACCATSGA